MQGRGGVGARPVGQVRSFQKGQLTRRVHQRLRDVEILFDVAREDWASGHKMPNLEAFQKRKDEVLRCVDEMKVSFAATSVLARDRVLPCIPSLVIRRFAGSRADPEWESFRRDVQGVEVHEQVHRRVQ